MTWEMSLEKRLVNRDRFYGRNFVFAFEADDPVNHQEWGTMRQYLHHFVRVQPAIAYRDRARRTHCASSRLLPSERASKLRIRRVAGLHRQDVTANPPADQRKVADYVEDFVANEFIGEAQWLFA